MNHPIRSERCLLRVAVASAIQMWWIMLLCQGFCQKLISPPLLQFDALHMYLLYDLRSIFNVSIKFQSSTL